MIRPRTLLLALLVLLSLAAASFAQDKTTIVQAADTFPASLGYTAFGAASAAGAVLTGVIGKLWFALDAAKKDRQGEIDAKQAEVDKSNAALAQEKTDRRVDAEKYLREQKDIFKDVMLTCGAVTTGLAENTKAVRDLTGRNPA